MFCGYDADVVIRNSLFWNNQSLLGPEIALAQGYDGSVPSKASLSYTLIQGAQGGVSADSNCTLLWGVGNISDDPCFARPGCWDPNGTPADASDDILVEGDYHLRSQAGRWDPVNRIWIADNVTSPCIDAGDPNSPIGLEPFPNGGRINMGAYGDTAEASKSYFAEPPCETIVAGDINGDCRVDLIDLAILARHWLGNRSVSQTALADWVIACWNHVVAAPRVKKERGSCEEIPERSQATLGCRRDGSHCGGCLVHCGSSP